LSQPSENKKGYRGPRPDLAAINRNRSLLFKQHRALSPTKPCHACGTTKPPSEFSKNNKTYDGRATSCKDCSRKANRDAIRALLVNLRGKIFDKLGHSCRRCGFADKRALQIDHVHGGGKGESRRGGWFYRKVLADTSGAFQILCANCNWIKRHENGEIPKRVSP
jgi:hypothetical protein